MAEPSGRSTYSKTCRPVSEYHDQYASVASCDTNDLSAEESCTVSRALQKRVNQIGNMTIAVQFCQEPAEATAYGRRPVLVENLGIVPEKAMKGDPKSHYAR